MMYHLWNSRPKLMFERLADIILLLFCARLVVRINSPNFTNFEWAQIQPYRFMKKPLI